ncbi:hypothetical protein AB0J86_04940 [Micromonospora sp. NPDC049559]|uniref:hypothetical protein n=1 Tax=Micromonospora sp. NPDC049559 TaxID=3155923 RepID=UPI003443BE02
MTAVGAAEEAAIIDKLNGLVERIMGKIADLQDNINSKSRWLPGPLRDKVIAGWNQFVGALERFWEIQREFWGNMGSPSTLWNTADLWSDTVGGPVSGQVPSAKAGKLQGDNTSNWQGNAAEQYRQGLPLHEVALDKIRSSLSEGISSALSDLAKGIIAFWAGLGVALAAFVAGMIGAVSSSATIVGLPAAPFIAVGAALAAGAAFLSGSLILKSVASSNNSTLRQKLNDNSGFDAGHWPKTTTTV